MIPNLSGVRTKLNRAQKHFDEVDAAVESTLGAEKKREDAPPYKYEPRRCELSVFCPKPGPVDPALPVAIGDCIHNLRSALDHLAFQLAVLNNKASEAEKKISFPVCLTRKEFDSFVGKKLAPFIDGKALAEIEELQPYNTGAVHDADVLWVISQLDIIDKHRLLVVIARHLRPIGVKMSLPNGRLVTAKLPDSEWAPMEDGTEIARVNLLSMFDAPGKVEVNLEVSAMVSLKDTGLAVCEDYHYVVAV